jgi:23S rRNA pseudouridine1911/1915/1917 synthase
MNPNVIIDFEDDHLLVAWKPHGVLTSGNSRKTFRAMVRTSTGLQQIEPSHRLDFATSGWMIFGKNKRAIRAVNEAFEMGEIKKKYWALCHGHMPQKLIIKLPLDGKPSGSIVEVKSRGTLAQSSPLSAAVVETLSGRTHQIRRHLEAAGHGVVGDDKFPSPGGVYKGRGLFLCAHQLTFTHPITGAALEVKSLPSKKFTSIPWVHKVLNKQALPLSSSL